MKQLLKQLESHKKKIEKSHTKSFSVFKKTMLGYQKYVNTYKDFQEYTDFKSSKHYETYADFFRQHEMNFIQKNEFNIASKILKHKQNLVKDKIEDIAEEVRRQSTIKHFCMEMGLAAYENINKIAIVGCGPFPNRAIVFATVLPNTQIVCLDIDKKAIKTATKVVELHNLNEQITLENIDGKDFDYSGFECTFISNFVQPKQEIILKIFEGNPEAQILVRNPRYLSNMVYENILDSGLNQFVKNQLVVNGGVKETILLQLDL